MIGGGSDGLFGSDDEDQKQKKPQKVKGGRKPPNDRSPEAKNATSQNNGAQNGSQSIKSKKRTKNKPQEEIKENEITTRQYRIKSRNGGEEDDEKETDLEAYVESEYAVETTNGLTFDEKVEMLTEEDDYGWVEYKWKLVNPTPERVEHLITQMKFRLEEGHGEATYKIGVEDNGNPLGLEKDDMIQSLKTLCYMASRLRADIILMRMKKGLRGKIAEVMVRANQRDGIKLDVRVMVLGDIGAGKSTLIGVLTSGRPDNGKGRARSTVCFHKHERYTGRTSSIYHHIVGFNSQGKITNHEIFSNSWAQIIDLSTKIVTFIDIGGAEKYAKLIIYGLCSLYPDYVLLVVSASNGVTKNTEDKISLAFQFKVPLVVVMTHCDVATNDQVETTEEALRYLLKRYQKYPIGVRDVTDVVESSRWLKENVTPLFKISSTNVASLEHFITFLNLLPVKDDWSSKKMLSSEFFISDIFEVEGKSIIGGTVIKGVVRKQHPLYLGPGVRGDFIKVNVESVQCKRVQVRSAACGQSCTLALKFTEQGKEWLKLNTLRRGMVLVDGKLNPRAAYEFLAEMMLFEGTAGDSERKLTKNYEPVIHSQTTRQACSLISASEISMPAPMDALSRKRSHSSESKFKHREDHHEHRGESSPEEGNKYQIFVLGKKKVFPSTNNLAQSQIMKIAEVPEEETNDSPTFTQQQPNSTESPTIVGSKLTRKTASSRPRKLTETIEERKEVIEENREYVLSVKPNRSFLLRLRFKYNPEYVTLGQKIIINDSKLRAIGFVKEIYY